MGIFHHPHYADVAQLVERLICNQRVGGSSPFVGSIRFVHWKLFFKWVSIFLGRGARVAKGDGL